MDYKNPKSGRQLTGVRVGMPAGGGAMSSPAMAGEVAKGVMPAKLRYTRSVKRLGPSGHAGGPTPTPMSRKMPGCY